MAVRSLVITRWLCFPVALALLLGCGGDENRPDEFTEAGGDRQPEEELDDWPCETKGYPCTWEEVNAETTERGFRLADQALDRFEPGAASEVLAWLAAQPDVIESGEEDPSLIWFRVEGGRPIFVQGPLPPSATELLLQRQSSTSSVTPAPDPDIRLASSGALLIEAWRALSSLVAWRDATAPALAIGVTGRDRNRDRRVNQRDQRKALILEPMDWEFCYETYENQYDRLLRNDSNRERRRVDRLKRANAKRIENICVGRAGPETIQGLGFEPTPYLPEGIAVQDVLEAMPAYAGNVTLLIDEAVDPSVLGSLNQYDVIHINSHGSRRSVTLGASVAWSGRGKVRGGSARVRGLDVTVFRAGSHGPRKRTWSADRRLFRSLHPRGLDRALIFLSSCSSLANPAQGDPPLARALLGRESMLVGWGATIGVSKARSTAVSFYLHLAEGWSGEEAIRRIPEIYGSPIFASEPARREDIVLSEEEVRLVLPGGIDEYMAEHGPEGHLKRGAVFGSRGEDMRIREVTRLLHPRSPLSAAGPRQVIHDGDDLDRLVVGELDDGVDDQLRVTVEVEAIKTEEVESTRIHLELDGRRIGEAEALTARDKVGDEDLYQHDFENVPVGKDLKPEQEYELEAVVSLPEGGESRYSARLKSEECPVYIQGEFEGQLGGGHAQVFERGRDTQAKIFLHDKGGGIPGFRLPPALHLEQRGGGRNGWGFFFNAQLDGPVVPGARFRVERGDLMDPEVRVSGSYRASRDEDAMSFPLGSANIVIHRVRWLEIDEGAIRRGMACGEVEANLQGLVPETYPFVFVPHTFKATFWAEIRRE